MDMVTPIRAPSGFLHKSRYSSSKYCLPFPKSGGNSDVAVGLDDLTYDRIRNHSHFPSSHASWTAFKAYPPVRVARKAYYLSRRLPNDLPVELIPERQLLSNLNIFRRGPDFGNIALFFLPDGETDRSLKDYVCLRDLVRNQEYAIRASICDDIELLIFTSKHLPVDTESLTAGLKNDLFLWGLFRHAKHGPAPRNIPEEISLSGLSHGNSNSGLVSRSDDNEPGDPDDDRPNSCRESDGKSTIGVHSTVQWSPPCAGWVKLNTSAVWKEDTGTTGVGGLVHGSVSMTRLPN
ncbi:hypothetical protein CRG98_031163 [Punica granatum]|uniref:AIPP2-like SPOC-like domain-containing protein n=1 Tax=Punica granatum TaxID=22663 RepID=A0A2I0IWT5_PUNGR|nr:hypothetical protein CRG98_031163 [Punica granatum]